MSELDVHSDASLLWKVPASILSLSLTATFAAVPERNVFPQPISTRISASTLPGVTPWMSNWEQERLSENTDEPTVDILRAFTGLTASQLARLFGVSRRSINNWLIGERMADKHKVRLSRLWAVVSGLSGNSPEERRAQLLDASHSKSLFESLAAEVSEERQIIHDYPLSARNQLGL